MKRIIFILAVVLLPVVAMAQMTIATVNVQEVFNAVPQSKTAQSALNDLSAKYQQEYAVMQSDFSKKYAAYQQVSTDASVPTSIKERRMAEIRQDDRAMDAFVSKTQEELAAAKQELEAPVYALINEAIASVASRRGFTYVLDVSRTPVVYQGEGAVDLTAEVISIVTAQ